MQQRFKNQLRHIVNECWETAADQDLSLDDLAKKSDLHYNTLWKLVHGVTRFPQWQTVVAFAKAVGLDVAVVGLNGRAKKRGAA